MRTPDPEYLSDPKFENFRKAIDKLETTDGIMSLGTIETRYEEARFAYCDVNNNFYPVENSPPDKRLKRAAFEAKTRNLYDKLRVFEKKLQAEDTNSSVIDAPDPDEIMKELDAYRQRVGEMKITPAQSAAFCIYASRFAEDALRRGEVSEKRIEELLGTAHRPAKKANPAASPEP